MQAMAFPITTCLAVPNHDFVMNADLFQIQIGFSALHRVAKSDALKAT